MQAGSFTLHFSNNFALFKEEILAFPVEPAMEDIVPPPDSWITEWILDPLVWSEWIPDLLLGSLIYWYQDLHVCFMFVFHPFTLGRCVFSLLPCETQLLSIVGCSSLYLFWQYQSRTFLPAPSCSANSSYHHWVLQRIHTCQILLILKIRKLFLWQFFLQLHVLQLLFNMG